MPFSHIILFNGIMVMSQSFFNLMIRKKQHIATYFKTSRPLVLLSLACKAYFDEIQ
ncbi:hypothetical protein NRIC_26560 [Enterococcus florum]|uniref:Uncharacterized protein n=1 Tax=Enterococcus florum TaxID=2480627 RepID=A0A4P5P9K2_9ENTE|nr:hypothetical protein NRIC_26560 [Enterococcus florum]